MKVVEVFCMNGGVGDTSYANNSLLRQRVILMTKPIADEAIASLYANLIPPTISIADFGCSSGPNTLKLRLKSSEFQAYLNDLPSNDFNTIFQSLPKHQEDFRREMGEGFGPCFFNGVAGSFYHRLFPTDSLHFVYSSYSLHWLSQVPEGIEENKGNIYLSATSPPSVIKEYYEQFERDFSTFLMCRAEELKKGGRMVVTMLGRKTEDPTSKDGGHIWELLAMALNDLVVEGVVEEEKVNSFNIPKYTPSPAEIRMLIEKNGSFTVNFLEASQIHWTAIYDDDDINEGGYNVAKCMRAVAEPMLLAHFGEGIIEQVFHKYRDYICDSMSKHNTHFFNVVVSLIRN